VKIKTMIVLAALLCGLLMVGGGVWAMSSGSYAIDWDVIGGGGEPANSAGYAIRSTIGQPVGETSFSTNYKLGSGYWHPLDGTLISGVTTEVNCQPLDAVTLQLFDSEGVTPIGDPATSDGSGNYTLAASVSETGSYEVVASKTGFKDEAQSISITELGQEYTMDFRGDHGLIPDAPDVFYILECVNLWLYGEDPCALTVFKVLAVVNAWLYPA
jgi:hypothetical protein